MKLSRETTPLAFTMLIFFISLPLQLSLANYIDYAILTFGYCAIFLISKFSKISISDLGLTRMQLKSSISQIIGICSAIVLLFFGTYFFDSSVFNNSKFDQSIESILLYVFLLLPVQVVLFEELLFRGLMLKTFGKLFGFLKSALISSVLFGIWHVLSSRNFDVDFDVSASPIIYRSIIIFATVIITGMAGFVLCWLRKKYDSLYLPIFVHWTINSTGVILAFLASK